MSELLDDIPVEAQFVDELGKEVVIADRTVTLQIADLPSPL